MAGVTRAMMSSGLARASGSSLMTWRSMAIPISCAATREARRRASGRPVSRAMTGSSSAARNSRSMAAAPSWDTAERTRARMALRLLSLSTTCR